MWHVYVLYSGETDRLYTGISPDPVRRLDQHNGKRKGGAKATRAGRPWVLVFCEPQLSKSAALKREAAIKKMTHEKKVRFVGL